MQNGSFLRFGRSTFVTIFAAIILLIFAMIFGTALNNMGQNYRQKPVAPEERKSSLDLQPAILGEEVQQMLKADAARHRKRARAKASLDSGTPPTAERTSLSGAE